MKKEWNMNRQECREDTIASVLQAGIRNRGRENKNL